MADRKRNSMFIRKEAGADERPNPVSQGINSRFFRMTDSERENYVSTVDESLGLPVTPVPRALDSGRPVDPTMSRFGRTVVGHHIRVMPGGGEEVLGEFIPAALASEEDLEPEEERTDQEDESGSEVQTLIDAAVAEALVEREVQKAAPAPVPQVEREAQKAAPSPQDILPGASVRVKMEGAFGSYRGKYKRLVLDGRFVVLCYDIDTAVFTPPAGTGAFVLSCAEREMTVHFLGIQFELEELGLGFQVMVVEQE